jgi:hypothetical protein
VLVGAAVVVEASGRVVVLVGVDDELVVVSLATTTVVEPLPEAFPDRHDVYSQSRPKTTTPTARIPTTIVDRSR